MKSQKPFFNLLDVLLHLASCLLSVRCDVPNDIKDPLTVFPIDLASSVRLFVRIYLQMSRSSA